MTIDLADAIDTVNELLEGLRELDGTEVEQAPTRAAQRQRMQLTRTLLRLSHLGDKASVQVMDVYHDYKHRDMPTEE